MKRTARAVAQADNDALDALSETAAPAIEGMMTPSALLRCVAGAAALLATAAAAAQTAVDGDTLRMDGKTYRLWGIDAPESAQTCRDGWQAGRMATTRLEALMAGKSVQCQERGVDRRGRTIAVCHAGGQDIGERMVREGYAWAFTRYSYDYTGSEMMARKADAGVHAHSCLPAWEWRAQRHFAPK